MPNKHRSAADRLSHHRQKQIATWVPVELLTRLDEKLAKKWLDHPDQPRPSRQSIVVEAIRTFVDGNDPIHPTR